ncbi:hypothetical protein MC885_006570 [Smutsia gigantea]|nr:hypothetical protein MC885_006570 [Smutsia gigantea]
MPPLPFSDPVLAMLKTSGKVILVPHLEPGTVGPCTTAGVSCTARPFGESDSWKEKGGGVGGTPRLGEAIDVKRKFSCQGRFRGKRFSMPPWSPASPSDSQRLLRAVGCAPGARGLRLCHSAFFRKVRTTLCQFPRRSKHAPGPQPQPGKPRPPGEMRAVPGFPTSARGRSKG